jgi:hypothetical protein
MTLSPSDLDRVEALARAATPGPWYQAGLPWYQVGSGVLAGSPDPHVGYLIVDCEEFEGERAEYLENKGDVKLADADDDAAFIAAANPAFVISLIEHARSLQSALAEKTAECEQEKQIVSRIWTMLGGPSYEELQGRSIYDLIAELLKDRAKLSLAQARIGELEKALQDEKYRCAKIADNLSDCSGSFIADQIRESTALASPDQKEEG